MPADSLTVLPTTLGELLRMRARQRPEQALVCAADGEAAMSYGDLNRHASEFAQLLKGLGCAVGDRIVIGFGNTPEFFVALFGCWRAGLIAVPVDQMLAGAELQAIVRHAQPVLVVSDPGAQVQWQQLQLTCPLIEAPAIGHPPVTGESGDWENEPGSTQAPADSPALLLYTSGTTGEPKGVLYSHGNLLAKLRTISEWFGFDSSYVTLCLLPTHFGHGLICNCLPVLDYGGTLILSAPFNLDLIGRLWPIIERHGVNYFSSVPTVVRLLLQHVRRDPVRIAPSLKFVTCASAPLRTEEVEKFQSTFGVPLLNCYGLTETTGWSTCSANDPHRDLGAVGKAITGELRVVDALGQPLPPGQQGEIQIRGPAVMLGYFKNPALTASVMRDGWFATGDVGALGADGTVTLHSRIKELIICAGKNVYPAEVDDVLMSHPDVTEACTVGLEDALTGEQVAACVVRVAGSALSAQALIAHAQQRVAAYKCPKRILFVDSIPRTSRGKVNRSSLCTLFAKEAARSVSEDSRANV
jgi:long-chain acyl-CoA synthetase